jgi:hypothetical protein
MFLPLRAAPTMLSPRNKYPILSGRYKTSSSVVRQGRLSKTPHNSGAGIEAAFEEGITTFQRDAVKKMTGQSIAMIFQTVRHGYS